MASIRKRGNSYLLVVSMGYTPDGRRRNPQQKTVKPPTGLTPKQTEKWLQEQAMLFEMSCKKLNPDIDRSITLPVLNCHETVVLEYAATGKGREK